MPEQSLVPLERIERAILVLRGHKVMLDSDLATLYAVETKVVNQAISRNIERFPEDFMFQLTEAEAAFLRSQTVTLKTGRGQHRKYLPYAFTEQGVAMLSSVLRSPRAVQVNIEIMRAFVRLRGILAAHKDLARRLDSLEAKYDKQFSVVFEAIRQLMVEPEPPNPARVSGRGRRKPPACSADWRKSRPLFTASLYNRSLSSSYSLEPWTCRISRSGS
jgi:phage regulator Rha-like protein